MGIRRVKQNPKLKNNSHKMLLRRDLHYIHTLEIPKTLKRTLENPKSKP
jgi:hypothetical protein